MEHPKRVGDRTTLAVMAALDGLGYGLYVPFGENTRVDLVIDNGAGLVRVQIDAFAVFCAETRGVYLVPIDAVPPKRGAISRVDAPRNHQRRGIRFARDFEIAKLSLTAVGPAQDSRSSSGGTAPSATPRIST